jgi:hypothetical protein
LQTSARHALTAHGSQERDIDLVAVPWTVDAALPAVVAEAIRAKAESLAGFAFALEGEQRPSPKPHRRMCWSFHLGGGPYIDLSVMMPSEEWGWEPEILQLSAGLARNS